MSGRATGRAQRGLALLLLLFVVFLGAAALLIQRLHPTAPQLQRDMVSDAALVVAKEALLAYAATYAESHPNKLAGYLPCPDTGSHGVNVHEGSPDPPCGRKGVSVIGRLPWHQLGVDPPRDGSGECLWYAVSGAFKNDPAADLLNWDSLGQFTIMAPQGRSIVAGAAPEDLAAAVIFAPGAPLRGQNRDGVAQAPLCGGNYVAANYLDSDGDLDNAAVSALAGAITRVGISGYGNAVNDRLLTITPREVFALLQKRGDFVAQIKEHLRRLGSCVAAYGGRNGAGAADPRLPWAAPLVVADYGNNSAYADQANLLGGRLPYRVDRSRSATANTMGTAELINSSNCPPPWSALDDEWYKNWKDHLFYAVAGAFAPGASAPGACGSCLRVNGSGRYAAVLLFAGARVAGQSRADNGDRSAIANYLEQRNATNYPNAGGDADYQSTAANAAFNDIAYCIDTSLQVAPCP